MNPAGGPNTNDRPVYHPYIKKSVQKHVSRSNGKAGRKASRDSADPLAGSSSTAFRQHGLGSASSVTAGTATPVPMPVSAAAVPAKPRLPVMLGASTDAQTTEYRGTAAAAVGLGEGGGRGGGGGRVPSAVLSDVAPRAEKAVGAMKGPVRSDIAQQATRPMSVTQNSLMQVTKPVVGATGSVMPGPAPQGWRPMPAKKETVMPRPGPQNSEVGSKATVASGMPWQGWNTMPAKKEAAIPHVAPQIPVAGPKATVASGKPPQVRRPTPGVQKTIVPGFAPQVTKAVVANKETVIGPRNPMVGTKETIMSDLPPQIRKPVASTKESAHPLPPWQLQENTHTRPPPIHISNPSTASPAPNASPQTPQPSKRGRPRGWKPGMSYAAIRGAGSSPGQSTVKKIKPNKGNATTGEVKRRGRPPKQPSPPPRDLYHRQEVCFIAFLCEWAGCKAELQNLATLRRHVRVVHLKSSKGMTRRECRWGKCGRVEEGMGVEFTGQKLERHVEERHLIPFGWHIGDGPRNSTGYHDQSRKRKINDDDVPDYLKDAKGNQVTPSIKDQVVEDYLTWRSNRKKLRKLLRERDRNLPSDDEDSPLEGEDVPV